MNRTDEFIEDQTFSVISCCYCGKEKIIPKFNGNIEWMCEGCAKGRTRCEYGNSLFTSQEKS